MASGSPLFLYILQYIHNIFKNFIVKKVKRRIIFYDIHKSYEIQVLSTNIGNSHTHLITEYLRLLSCYNSRAE